jgi:hypothetical protein
MNYFTSGKFKPGTSTTTKPATGLTQTGNPYSGAGYGDYDPTP